MNENPQNKKVNTVPPIDLGKIFKDILKHKTLYFKVLPVAFVLAAVYALSLPNYYSCTVKLAPELGTNAQSGGSLAGLASSFGINLGGSEPNPLSRLDELSRFQNQSFRSPCDA